MAVHPVVRYMILCEDWETRAEDSTHVTIHGLISSIRSLDHPPYPLLYEEICIFLLLTECRGNGSAQIICIFEESGEKVFETPMREVKFGPNPLEVVALPFRIRDCPFPRPGMYSVQFWYNGVKLAESPLLLR
jgi:hypothetical protein